MGTLRWSDVDLDRPELSTRRAITQFGRKLIAKDTKTHQSRRVAPDEATVGLLRQHRAAVRRWPAAARIRSAVSSVGDTRF